MRRPPSSPLRPCCSARCLRVAWLVVALGLAGCGFPREDWAFHRALLDADRLADDELYAEAYDAYAALAPEATREDLARYVRFRLAYMLEQQGRIDEALAAYEAIWRQPRSVHDHEAARAMWHTAEIYRDHLGDLDAWVAWSIRVVETYPNAIPADDALRELQRHWRELGQPEAFVTFAAARYEALAHTQIADNLVYWSGRALQEDLGDPQAALEMYRVIRFNFHRSGFWDDAIWRSALAYRQLHERDPLWRNEVGQSYRDLEERTLWNFLEAREVSWVMADYESPHYVPSLFRLAELREQREEWAEAIAVYRRFQRMYPLSLRVDDVQFHIMELQARLGDVEGMRASLAWLRDEYPLSRWIDDGEALIAATEAAR